MNVRTNTIFRIAISFSAACTLLAEPTRLIEDIPYAGTDNPRQMLDLILPVKEMKEPLPVVAFIHGGGWRNGDRKRSINKIRAFAESGNYAAVSIGYRLTGESQWPTQIHDCKAAIRWIRANAEEYGIDPDRIAVWGSSAGGHLVAMLGTSGDVPAMDGSLGPNKKVSSRVACVVDFYGPTDFLTMDKTAIPESRMRHDAPDSPEALLLGGPIQDIPDKVATANPITYVTPDDPPFLIVHGTMDPLVSINQSELLHAALKKAGAISTMITVKGGGHGQGFGPDVDAAVKNFFDHHLRGMKIQWSDHAVPAVERPGR